MVLAAVVILMLPLAYLPEMHNHSLRHAKCEDEHAHHAPYKPLLIHSELLIIQQQDPQKKITVFK
jgi:hypothetical protein